MNNLVNNENCKRNKLKEKKLKPRNAQEADGCLPHAAGIPKINYKGNFVAKHQAKCNPFELFRIQP